MTLATHGSSNHSDFWISIFLVLYLVTIMQEGNLSIRFDALKLLNVYAVLLFILYENPININLLIR